LSGPRLAQGTAKLIAGSGQHFTADVSAMGIRTGTLTFRFYTYNNAGAVEPDRGASVDQPPAVRTCRSSAPRSFIPEFPSSRSRTS